MAGENKTVVVFTEEARRRYPEDTALVRRCIAGERAAWGELLAEHEAVIHFTVRSVLTSHLGSPSAELVEDVQADVVLALVTNECAKLRSWSGRCKLRSWLKVVTHHLTIDRLRRSDRRTVSLDDTRGSLRESLQDTGPDPERLNLERSNVERVFALAQVLPAEDREFLRLFVGEGLDFAEIATKLGSTMGAVYARKNRVRKKLTQLYRDDCQISGGGTS